MKLEPLTLKTNLTREPRNIENISTMPKTMPINYARALKSTTGIPSAHETQEAKLSDSAKTYAWLKDLKTEVSIFLEAKIKLQNKLENLKILRASRYKDKNASHLPENSVYQDLLVMIEDIEMTEQQQLEMLSDSISLRELMNETNQKIKEKEALIFKGAATLAEMNRQQVTLEKSSGNISLSLSNAIFKQLNKDIVDNLKDKSVEYASNTDTNTQSKRLWMHYVEFTLRLCHTEVKAADKAINNMKYVINRLMACDNFERMLPFIQEYTSETQYNQELARYQSFKNEFIQTSISMFDWALRKFSSQKMNATQQHGTQSYESILNFFSLILKKLQASDTAEPEKFQLVTAGAKVLIDAAFQCKPDLRKRQDISLSLFKSLFLERQKNMNEQDKQRQALESLKTSVERENFAYEKNQRYLKLLLASSQRMKQDLKKQAGSFASEIDRQISQVWLKLDDCKTEITTLLNTKLVWREDNEQGLFTCEAMKGVLNRHLMTEKQLQARLTKNENLKAASSYKDEIALLEALQTTVIPKLKQADRFNEHLHLEHTAPVEGWSLIRQESGIPLKKTITHSRVSFATTNSGCPLIAHLYPCAD